MPRTNLHLLCACVLALATWASTTTATAAGGSLDCRSGVARDAAETVDAAAARARLQVAGLTDDGRLVCFDTRRPARVRWLGSLAGLAGDSRLIGIDYRPQDGMLYGVGDTGGLYRIDTATAALTRVGALSVTPSGKAFGVDFNPAANALRIVSDTGQNLRQSFANLDLGAPLAATAVDASLDNGAGAAVLGVGAAGYTNNDVGASTTGTTLFVVNAASGQVAVQSPANAGLVVPTGSLGVAAAGSVGFDIYSTLRDGVAVGNRALAVLPVGDQATLHEVDLLTGTARPLGAIGAAVVAIAIPPSQH